MANTKRKALGRGMDVLFPGKVKEQANPPLDGGESDRLLALDPKAIRPNPMQPRKAFSEEALQELADSIRRNGVQEPVIVRKTGDAYELVSGERRVRASVMAGLETVPAICRNVPDADMLRLGLIENIQREDLNPIELAQAYQRLQAECHWTQEQLADEVGKKRVTVANTIRLLNLPEDIQAYVTDGTLSMGHARALLALPKPEAQRAAARKIITRGLSVREAEKLAAPPTPKPKKSQQKDPNIAHIEEDLRRRLGTKVSIRHGKQGRGKIEVEYYSLDDFERILGALGGRA